MGHHLGSRVVDQRHDAAVETVTKEKAYWPAFGQASADADEKASADCSSNSNQLNMAVVQAAMEAIRIDRSGFEGLFAVFGLDVVSHGVSSLLREAFPKANSHLWCKDSSRTVTTGLSRYVKRVC